MFLSAIFLTMFSLSSFVASNLKNAVTNVDDNELVLSLNSDLNEPEMVLVPAGSVRTPELYPSVEIEGNEGLINIKQPFYISKYKITFSQWDECVKYGGCTYSPDDNQWGRDNRPVINISWLDIDQYLSWLSKSTGKDFRLPTELEWEYAARAGSSEKFGPPPLFTDPKLAWASTYIAAPSQSLTTQPVREGRANAFGIVGTRGNVWEWTDTCFQSKGGNGEKNCGIRILRGDHRTYLPDFLREIGTGGCAVAPLPGNFGFRIVSAFPFVHEHISQ